MTTDVPGDPAEYGGPERGDGDAPGSRGGGGELGGDRADGGEQPA
ncbi:hypothetical protein [Solwaraspora sp. WMMA2101]